MNLLENDRILSIMKERILVTGGTGYIGSHTVVELQNSGYDVVIVDNLSNSSADVVDNIEKVSGIRPAFEKLDCLDFEGMDKLFTKYPGIKGIIHFAASKAVGESVQKPLLYYRNNLVSLINLLELMPKHVVYVWLDALTNYITGIGYDVDGNSTELFHKNWPADLHLIGKDIIRFHTIYWPIFLMALDLPLPKQVFGHPWLLQGDGKMSKSKGNVIYADELVHLFGVDAVRYFVLHEMPFDNDGVITWELMVERMNSDLANTLGNLVNRTVSMTNKYFGGTVTDKGIAEEVDSDLKRVTKETSGKVDAKMEDLRVADAITEIFNLFKRCNKYIDETMPWALAKEEDKKGRLETVLFNLISSISEGARLLTPYMPETSGKILAQLGGGHVTDKPEILFARRDLKEVMEEVEKLHPAQPEEEPEEEGPVIDIEAKPEIAYDDFMKMQFQVGEIIKCEEVPKSKKLLCSQVKIGSQVRQIVSGIKKWYSPEEMVGKKVMVLVNLKPAKLAGVLSEGMILCAEDENGNIVLMKPEKDVPAGAEIC